eukprot:Opistho-2@55922
MSFLSRFPRCFSRDSTAAVSPHSSRRSGASPGTVRKCCRRSSPPSSPLPSSSALPGALPLPPAHVTPSSSASSMPAGSLSRSLVPSRLLLRDRISGKRSTGPSEKSSAAAGKPPVGRAGMECVWYVDDSASSAKSPSPADKEAVIPALSADSCSPRVDSLSRIRPSTASKSIGSSNAGAAQRRTSAMASTTAAIASMPSSRAAASYTRRKPPPSRNARRPSSMDAALRRMSRIDICAGDGAGDCKASSSVARSAAILDFMTKARRFAREPPAKRENSCRDSAMMAWPAAPDGRRRIASRTTGIISACSRSDPWLSVPARAQQIEIAGPISSLPSLCTCLFRTSMATDSVPHFRSHRPSVASLFVSLVTILNEFANHGKSFWSCVP